MSEPEESARKADDGEPASAAAPGAAPADQDAAGAEQRFDLAAAWDAVQVLADALREGLAALLGLARSEVRLALASWPWVFGLTVLMVGLSLSLWASLIALLGWALYVLTGSVGWALAALVGVHLSLIVVARLLLRRTARNMTLPATRAEVSGLLGRARGRPGDSP